MDKKKLAYYKKASTLSFFIWLGCVTIFIILILIVGNKNVSELQTKLFQIVFIIGVLAFTSLLFLSILERTKKFRKKVVKNINKVKSFKQLSLALLFIFLLPAVIYGASMAEKQKIETRVKNENFSKQSSYTSLIPTLMPTSSIKPNNSITCNINKNCGGGTFLTKTLAECERSTCCGIGNKWILYKDRDQCIKDQKSIPQTVNCETLNGYVSMLKTDCDRLQKEQASWYGDEIKRLTNEFIEASKRNSEAVFQNIRLSQEQVNSEIEAYKNQPITNYEPSLTPFIPSNINLTESPSPSPIVTCPGGCNITNTNENLGGGY